ncbi:alpha/beta fold hydrolase [Planosporangium sp. 12N6]|uniref:alpha/beta fold hydrolase n=1 Tax=Planosporangium spinosum TaxID=3402278 RepID=UPI003CF3B04A
MAQYTTAVRAVDVAGVELAYRDTGAPDGPPVVLLHGGSSNSGTWDRLTAVLTAGGHRVVAPDLRGHGGSTRTPAYPLSGFRDDIVGLLDALALDRVALVGHSLGGHAASLVAQQQPGRVTRLVLEDPPPPPREPTPDGGLSRARMLLLGLGSLSRRRRYDPAAVTSAVAQLRRPDPDWWDRLSVITAPTLMISGGPSSHISPQRLAEVARAIPDCRLVTIPVGHRVHSRSPERFRATVVPFLTGNR